MYVHQGGEKTFSHSSSNTLSSSASSSNSDEKHFGLGDLMDPELLRLAYIKGASTDSGIDTTHCCAPIPPTAAVDQEHMWNQEHPENRDGKPVHLYLPQSYTMTRHIGMESSLRDLKEILSHSR